MRPLFSRVRRIGRLLPPVGRSGLGHRTVAGQQTGMTPPAQYCLCNETPGGQCSGGPVAVGHSRAAIVRAGERHEGADGVPRDSVPDPVCGSRMQRISAPARASAADPRRVRHPSRVRTRISSLSPCQPMYRCVVVCAHGAMQAIPRRDERRPGGAARRILERSMMRSILHGGPTVGKRNGADSCRRTVGSVRRSRIHVRGFTWGGWNEMRSVRRVVGTGLWARASTQRLTGSPRASRAPRGSPFYLIGTLHHENAPETPLSHANSRRAACASPPRVPTRRALKVPVPNRKQTVRSGLPARTILMKGCLSATCKGSCDVRTPRAAPAPRSHPGEWA
jgi:hypothetical protein